MSKERQLRASRAGRSKPPLLSCLERNLGTILGVLARRPAQNHSAAAGPTALRRDMGS